MEVINDHYQTLPVIFLAFKQIVGSELQFFAWYLLGLWIRLHLPGVAAGNLSSLQRVDNSESRRHDAHFLHMSGYKPSTNKCQWVICQLTVTLDNPVLTTLSN